MNTSSYKLVLLSGLLFLAVSVFSVFLANYRLLAIYQVVSITLLAISAFVLAKLILKKILTREFIFKIIIFLGVLESVLAMVQFYLQKSVGLYFLGEPRISAAMMGVAKVLINNFMLLRGYGTFPHPNVLGGFLIMAIGGLYFIWFNEEKKQNRIFYAAALTVTIFGLAVTFSRSAWLAALFLTIFVLSKLFFTGGNRKKLLELTFVIAAATIALVLVFNWAIFPRVGFSFEEPAVSQRIDYAKMSLNVFKAVPFGVGIGNQVLTSIDKQFYQQAGLTEIWQWQPIHNIFLLILSELGFIGLIAFLLFIFAIFREGGFNLISGILISLLIIGLFDHYLWTLLPGRLMFWLVVGLIMGQSPLSSTDRISPSEGGDAGSIPAEGTK